MVRTTGPNFSSGFLLAPSTVGVAESAVAAVDSVILNLKCFTIKVRPSKNRIRLGGSRAVFLLQPNVSFL